MLCKPSIEVRANALDQRDLTLYGPASSYVRVFVRCVPVRTPFTLRPPPLADKIIPRLFQRFFDWALSGLPIDDDADNRAIPMVIPEPSARFAFLS